MPGQDPVSSTRGISTQSSVSDLLSGLLGISGNGAAEARLGMLLESSKPGEGGFNASPELQDEQTEQQKKIQDLIAEIMLLEMEKSQQQLGGDEEGAKQTQSRIDQKTAELNALTGGTDQGAGAPGGGGGVPSAGGGGGVPYGGGGGGGGPVGGGGGGGGVPSGGGGGGGGSSLNAPVQDGGGPPVDVSGALEPGGAAGIPEKYKNNQVAQLIWQESKKAGADPYAMLATAVVESGLNPKAVGDNGTSFGLYQYHIGGALGNRSKEWAFNPLNIIRDEAKRFASAGVHNGQGAAAVQRPADQAGYAVKVNNLIAEMKSGR